MRFSFDKMRYCSSTLRCFNNSSLEELKDTLKKIIMMKKILLLFGLLSVMQLGFSACSEDTDNDVPTGNSSIVGTWEVTGYKVNGHSATIRVEFGSNKTGTMSSIYDDGTDTDSYRFEYVLRNEGDYTYLTLIWTGTKSLIYTGGKEYEVTVTPTRLIWGNMYYTRK